MEVQRGLDLLEEATKRTLQRHCGSTVELPDNIQSIIIADDKGAFRYVHDALCDAVNEATRQRIVAEDQEFRDLEFLETNLKDVIVILRELYVLYNIYYHRKIHEVRQQLDFKSTDENTRSRLFMSLSKVQKVCQNDAPITRFLAQRLVLRPYNLKDVRRAYQILSKELAPEIAEWRSASSYALCLEV